MRVRNGLVVVLLGTVRMAAAVVALCILRIESDGLAIVCERMVVVAHVIVRVAAFFED